MVKCTKPGLRNCIAAGMSRGLQSSFLKKLTGPDFLKADNDRKIKIGKKAQKVWTNNNDSPTRLYNSETFFKC